MPHGGGGGGGGVSGSVDASLFGRPRRRQPFWEATAAAASAADQGAGTADVLVLEASELTRIKARSFRPTEAELERQRELSEQLEQERRVRMGGHWVYDV